MKSTAWMTVIAVTGLITVSAPVILPTGHFGSLQATAQSMMNPNQMGKDFIAEISKLKGKPGSADLMRKYYKDLTPIGIQPGGAGMVVNLYSKKEDTTISLCTTADVVVAIKKGKIARFQPAEVK